MAGVSFANLHRDLRLGLLLVVVVMLLDAGSSGTFGAGTSSGHLYPTPAQYGLLAGADVLVVLSIVASAIWVDRGPPHGMMAAGAVVLALGPFLALSDSFALTVTRIFFAGVGGAFVGPLIFYAVVDMSPSPYLQGSGRSTYGRTGVRFPDNWDRRLQRNTGWTGGNVCPIRSGALHEK